MPEFIQWGASPKRIAHEAVSLIENDGLKPMADRLAQVTAKLKRPCADGNGDGVALQVAAKILEYLHGSK